MRFHIVAGVYVIIFALFYNFTYTQWAVLLLLIAAILAAELFNTSLEELCNLETDGYDPLAKVAKDAAAGAVLVLSIFAAVIAVLFFWDLAVIKNILFFFWQRPGFIALLLISIAVSIIFVVLGPKGIRKFFLKIKKTKR